MDKRSYVALEDHDDLKQQSKPHCNQENVEIEVVSNNVTDDPHSTTRMDDQDDDNASVHETTNDEHHLTTQPVSAIHHEGINVDHDDVKNQTREDKFSGVRSSIRPDHETELKEQICMDKETNNINEDDDATDGDAFLTTNNDDHKHDEPDSDTDPSQASVFRKSGFNYWFVLVW
eukprot:377538_1